MKSFEFKPSLLRERDNWTIDSGMLTCNGELFCSLANVEQVHFAEMEAQQSRTTWLDLKAADNTRRRISCTAPAGDENGEQCLALYRETLDALAALKPEMKVSVGATGGGSRWAVFLLGIIGVVAGLAALGAVPGGLIAPALEVYALSAGAVLTLGGAALAFFFRPWVAPKRLNVSEARDYVASLSLDGDPSGAEQQGEAPEDDEGQGAATGRAD